MSDDPPSDRRHEPRVHSLNLVNVAQLNLDQDFANITVGRTIDLSRGGIRLDLHTPLPLRSTVKLTIALDGKLVEVEGTVCHLEVLDERRCSMGIAFDQLSGEAQAVIDAHLKHTAS